VRWVNRGEKPSSILYFHLYPNLRSGDQQSSANTTAADADEPHIDIVDVRSADDIILFSYLDDQGTTLRVNLREPVAPGAATEVVIKFKGSVPEIDRDETSLTTHVVKQVSAAFQSEREMRRARDINFLCRGVMLLGSAYPVLAVHDGDDWRRKLEPSVGDFVFNESANYEVTVSTNPGVEVFTSAPETGPRNEKTGQTFTASSLRDFAILAGRGLRVEHTEVDGVDVRSIYLAGADSTGLMLGNLMAAILSRPEVLERMLSDRESRRPIIDEMMRLEAVTGLMTRTAVKDTPVGNMVIPSGAQILLGVPGANRDARLFPSPEEIKLDRPQRNLTLTFGAGAHFCLGHHLAKEELRLAINRLLDRLPGLRLAGPPGRPGGTLFRFIADGVPIRFDAILPADAVPLPA